MYHEESRRELREPPQLRHKHDMLFASLRYPCRDISTLESANALRRIRWAMTLWSLWEAVGHCGVNCWRCDPLYRVFSHCTCFAFRWHNSAFSRT